MAEFPDHITTALPLPLPGDHESVALSSALVVINKPASAVGAVATARLDTIRLKFANWAGRLAPPAKSACSIPTSSGKPAKSARLKEATLVQAAAADAFSKRVKLLPVLVILSQ